MSIGELLLALAGLRITIRADGGDLVLKGQTQELPENVRAELIRKKDSLLQHLQHLRKPFIDQTGNLHIPLNCPLRYRWWQGGQPVKQTLAELNAPRDVWVRYSSAPYPKELTVTQKEGTES